MTLYDLFSGAGLAALLDICRAAEPDHVVLLRPISGANQTPKRRSGEATTSAHESLVSTLSEIGRMKQGPGPATVAFSVVDGFTFASSGWIGYVRLVCIFIPFADCDSFQGPQRCCIISRSGVAIVFRS